MRRNSSNWLVEKKGYSLLELLVVLSIVGLMISIVVYGMVKFRQTMMVSNATKEIALQLRKARRYAINNVVTEEGYSPSAYYIEFGNDDYKWGECGSGTSCSSKSVMSSEYRGVSVTGCKGANEFNYVKFNHVTGEFIFTNDINSTPPGGTSGSCIIEIMIEGLVSTTRKVEVDSQSRTIKIL